MINDAGFSTQHAEIGKKLTSAANIRQEIETDHWKYVDDLTIAGAILLKDTLENDVDNTLAKPLQFHKGKN